MLLRNESENDRMLRLVNNATLNVRITDIETLAVIINIIRNRTDPTVFREFMNAMLKAYYPNCVK